MSLESKLRKHGLSPSAFYPCFIRFEWQRRFTFLERLKILLGRPLTAAIHVSTRYDPGSPIRPLVFGAVTEEIPKLDLDAFHEAAKQSATLSPPPLGEKFVTPELLAAAHKAGIGVTADGKTLLQKKDKP